MRSFKDFLADPTVHLIALAIVISQLRFPLHIGGEVQLTEIIFQIIKQ